MACYTLIVGALIGKEGSGPGAFGFKGRKEGPRRAASSSGAACGLLAVAWLLADALSRPTPAAAKDRRDRDRNLFGVWFLAGAARVRGEPGA
jgi:hypothetical protein